jgi:nicotinamide-nucleotide amidase
MVVKAETIAVGSELLLGQIANTNAQIISRALQEIGIDVYFHTCVGDNRDRIIEVFKAAFGRSDVIIITGGLGPTMDDLTKETIASYLGLPLKVDEDSLERIKSFFNARGRHMTGNNYKQALIPEGATAILNKKGTAPGVLLNYKGKIIAMLPGPPFEMEPMLKDTVIPYLSKLSSKTIYSRVMKFFGIGESQLEEMIKDLLVNQSNPTIAPLAKKGEVTLRLTAKADDFLRANELILPLEEEIKRRVGRYLYGYDDETVEEIVARLLFQYNKTIAVAESCTGGLLAHKLTNIPGISKQFERGVVSYSNNSKLELLGVKKETLEKFGAVSEETAVEMARGIRLTSRTDIGVSITGIAGPDGGTLEKPVGLVYIGYADSDSSFAEKHIFNGDRIDIKERSADAALHLVRKKLQGSGD